MKELETPLNTRDIQGLPKPTPIESEGRGTTDKKAPGRGARISTRRLTTAGIPKRLPVKAASSATSVSASREGLQSQVAKLLCSMYPHRSHRHQESSIRSIVDKAYEYTVNVFERSAAIQWAEGFQFPVDIHERDEALLTAAEGDSHRRIQASQRPDRSSVDRVRMHVPSSDPNFDFLIRLAEGMQITVPPKFVCCAVPRPLRSLYLELSSPVNRLLYKQWPAGKTGIVRSSVVANIPGIHYTSAHWSRRALPLRFDSLLSDSVVSYDDYYSH
jgi:hypothetical protein